MTTRDSDEDDIQVIACYSESPEFPPQLAAGRTTTTDLTECLSYLSLPEAAESVTESYFREPSEEIREWFVGIPPSTYSGVQPQEHPIHNTVKLTQCFTHHCRRR